jgi:hypothetical protein
MKLIFITQDDPFMSAVSLSFSEFFQRNRGRGDPAPDGEKVVPRS